MQSGFDWHVRAGVCRFVVCVVSTSVDCATHPSADPTPTSARTVVQVLATYNGAPRPGDAAPSNHEESSGVFTRRSLTDREGFA